MKNGRLMRNRVGSNQFVDTTVTVVYHSLLNLINEFTPVQLCGFTIMVYRLSDMHK